MDKNIIQHNATDNFFDAIGMKYFEHKTIMDFGAGDCYASYRFLLSGAKRVDSVDIKFSNKKLSPKHTLYRNIPIENKYDVIFTHHAMEHIISAVGVFRLIYESLKNYGWLYLAVPNMDSINNYSEGHIHNYTMPQLIALLKNIGFATQYGFYWTHNAQLRLRVQKYNGIKPDYPARVKSELDTNGRCPNNIFEGSKRIW